MQTTRRREARSFTATWLATVAAFGATPLPAQAITGPYCSVDALYDFTADGRGEAHAGKIVHAANQALATLTPTSRAYEMYTFTNDALKDVAFDRFLTSTSGMAQPDHSRLFTFTGKQRDGEYTVDVPKAKLTSLKFTNFFDLGLQVAIRENAAKTEDYSRGYGVSAEGLLVLDEFSHRSVMQLASNELRVVDAANLSSLKTKPTALFKSVKGPARKMVEDLVAAYPRFAALLDHFEKLDTQITDKTEGNQHYSTIRIHSRLDLAALTKDYPSLGDYLERLTGNLTITTSTDYVLANGLKLWNLRNDTRSQTVDLTFNTAAGGLLPEDSKKHVHFDQLIVPTSVREQSAHLLTTLHIDVHGLTADVPKIVTAVHYKDSTVAELTVKLDSVAKPKFEGAFLGFLPPGLIDAFIPGSLDLYAQTLIQCLLTANKNQGTFAKVVIDTRRPDKVTLGIAANTELADNFFLRFGLRVANDYVWPDTDTLADARNFLSSSTQKLYDDIATMKPSPNRAALPVAH